MPHKNELEPKSHPYRILFGQKPLSKFTDYRKAIKVELLYAPPRDIVMPAVYDFVKATWSEDGRESKRATKEDMSSAFSAMLEGKALGLGIETIDFIFRIEGITRIDTHQIVRNRVGVTYSQQCTGDRFLTHEDVLVEECVAKNPKVLENFIKATLACKNSYAEMTDSMDVSIQAAREIMPHNLKTFIFMKVNLMTLMMFYKKRIDDGSQTWAINVVAEQMANEACKTYPELDAIFKKMRGSYTFQKDASADRKNTFSTSLYIPKDDEFDYHERDFLYQKTKLEMNSGTPILDRYFWGYTEVSKQHYDLIQRLYSEHDSRVHENNWSNSEIIEQANRLNLSIEKDILKI